MNVQNADSLNQEQVLANICDCHLRKTWVSCFVLVLFVVAVFQGLI